MEVIQNGLMCQGCLFLPLHFNLYINDLVSEIKESSTGVLIGDENICMLIYGDDLVLLAQNENDLPRMLNTLCEWCKNGLWKLTLQNHKLYMLENKFKCCTYKYFL